MRFCRVFDVIVLLFAAFINVLAEDKGTEKKTDELMSMSLDELLNMNVYSASKQAEKVSEAPGILSIATKGQIEQYGWTSINDILFSQPGFFPSQDYDRRTAGSRGLFEGWNNNHLLMLIDGVPFNDNLYGTAYTWEITPLIFSKSVETLRGPGSALYGSNATNGVVSLNTLNFDDLTNNYNFKFRIGSYDTRIYDVLGGENLNFGDMIFAFNHYSTSGNNYNSYDGSGRTNPDGSLAKFNVNDGSEGNYFFAKFSGKQSLEGFGLQLHYQDWSYGTGHGWLWFIPDNPESLKENRLLLSAVYSTKSANGIGQDYVIRFQNHSIDWNLKFYPNGAYDNFYPAGAAEYLKTSAQDVFIRVQISDDLIKNAHILGGLENTTFIYNGDDAHYSNFRMDGDFGPNADGRNLPLGAWLDWIKGNPVINIAGFAQFSSGDMIDETVKLTAGARYDLQQFNYNDLDRADRALTSRSFSQFSPRLGLVFIANENLIFKLLFGKAFRAPSPTEMFGANTFTLASNLKRLEPETITTMEGSADYKVSKNINWRLNGFYTKFENEIGYSLQNANLSTNIYTLTNAGVETELIFGYDNFTGFLNYSFAARIDESIIDSTIGPDKNDITWAPQHSLKFGVNYNIGKVGLSVQIIYQSSEKRRSSDLAIVENNLLRPSEVSGWVSADIHISWILTEYLSLSMSVKNIFDTEIYIVKGGSYPFDYQRLGRYVSAGVVVSL